MNSIKLKFSSFKKSLNDFLYSLYDPIVAVKRMERFNEKFYTFLYANFDQYDFAGHINRKRMTVIIIFRIISLLTSLRIIIPYFTDEEVVPILLMDISIIISRKFASSMILIIFNVSPIIMYLILHYQEYTGQLFGFAIYHKIKHNILTNPLSDRDSSRFGLKMNLLTIFLLNFFHYTSFIVLVVFHLILTIHIYLTYQNTTLIVASIIFWNMLVVIVISQITALFFLGFALIFGLCVLFKYIYIYIPDPIIFFYIL